MSNPVAIITDTHFGCRNESRVFADYFDEFLSNVFFPVLQQRGITEIIHLGDLMDRRKYTNHIAADRMLTSFIDRLKGKHLTIISGNHDIPYRDTLKASAVDVLLGHRDNVRIIRQPEFTEFGLIIPWICAENRDAVNEAIAMARRINTKTVMGTLR
jgi:metallophosphoesterase superfamily enzyme